MRKYGWINQLPDKRDAEFRSYIRPVPVPKSMDLRKWARPVQNQGGLSSSSAFCMPPIYDQGPLGSCTGNGIARVVQFDNAKQGGADFMPSRLFIYYNERDMEGTVAIDSGASIRDGVKSINKLGVCKETTWPYAIRKFTDKPPAAAYKEALECRSLIYHPIDQTASQIEQHLAAGMLIVFGFSVYESFESVAVSKTGKVPMPNLRNERVQGGHCAVLAGYKNRRGLVANSYGKFWGDEGYFTLPYDYFLDPDLASDFWVIEQTT